MVVKVLCPYGIQTHPHINTSAKYSYPYSNVYKCIYICIYVSMSALVLFLFLYYSLLRQMQPHFKHQQNTSNVFSVICIITFSGCIFIFVLIENICMYVRT